MLIVICVSESVYGSKLAAHFGADKFLSPTNTLHTRRGHTSKLLHSFNRLIINALILFFLFFPLLAAIGEAAQIRQYRHLFGQVELLAEAEFGRIYGAHGALVMAAISFVLMFMTMKAHILLSPEVRLGWRA